MLISYIRTFSHKYMMYIINIYVIFNNVISHRHTMYNVHLNTIFFYPYLSYPYFFPFVLFFPYVVLLISPCHTWFYIKSRNHKWKKHMIFVILWLTSLNVIISSCIHFGESDIILYFPVAKKIFYYVYVHFPFPFLCWWVLKFIP